MFSRISAEQQERILTLDSTRLTCALDYPRAFQRRSSLLDCRQFGNGVLKLSRFDPQFTEPRHALRWDVVVPQQVDLRNRERSHREKLERSSQSTSQAKGDGNEATSVAEGGSDHFNNLSQGKTLGPPKLIDLALRSGALKNAKRGLGHIIGMDRLQPCQSAADEGDDRSHSSQFRQRIQKAIAGSEHDARAKDDGT